MEKIDKKTIKALSAERRIEILKALAVRRKMPSELSREIGLAASTIIGHLNILEDAGLVERKDTGRKWIYYELTFKGRSIVKPKIPVQFVVVLSIGLLIMLTGFMNLDYLYLQTYEYPIVTIEKTITQTMTEVRAPAGESGMGIMAIPPAPNVTNVTNETSTTTYEIGYIEMQGINWNAFVFVILGTILFSIGAVRVIKK